MRRIRLSAPSKTFLVGEYAVLAGAPALILNTQPRFELIAAPGEGQVEGISPNSPAGQWLAKHPFPALQLKFTDPHQGRGGLGASSAQFLLAHALRSHLAGKRTDAQTLWADYQASTPEPGSGADVLSQLAGMIARTELRPVSADPERWAYPEIGFMILRTGEKLATHEHLRTLERERLTPLAALARQAYESYDAESAAHFLTDVKRYSKALRELEVQSPQTLAMLAPFEAQDWCLVTKGCGAFGADTALVFYRADGRREALAFARARDLEVVATETDLSTGLDVQVEPD